MISTRTVWFHYWRLLNVNQTHIRNAMHTVTNGMPITPSTNDIATI